MTKLYTLGLLVLGTAVLALAAPPPTAPEIDPGQAVTALTFLSGCALVLRGRRKR